MSVARRADQSKNRRRINVYRIGGGRAWSSTTILAFIKERCQLQPERQKKVMSFGISFTWKPWKTLWMLRSCFVAVLVINGARKDLERDKGFCWHRNDSLVCELSLRRHWTASGTLFSLPHVANASQEFINLSLSSSTFAALCDIAGCHRRY